MQRSGLLGLRSGGSWRGPAQTAERGTGGLAEQCYHLPHAAEPKNKRLWSDCECTLANLGGTVEA